jgi:hypothetical protein
MTRTMTTLAMLYLLGGCPDRTIAEVDTEPTGAFTKDIPITTDIDLLFVIDNSASTQDKQDAFLANFKNFTDALENFPGGHLPNVHIGVISTSVDIGVSGIDSRCSPASGENGRLQATARGACTAPTGNFISDIAAPNGARTKNYTDTLANTFKCIANLGTGGCGFESPLEAIKRALDGSRPENAGFLRKGAFLAVIILTDEDDCSASDKTMYNEPNATPAADFRCAMQAYECSTTISPTAAATYQNCRVKTTGSKLQDPAKYFEFLQTIKRPGQSVVALIGGDPSATIGAGPLTIDSSTGPVSIPQAVLPTCHATISGRDAVGRPANRLAAFIDKFDDKGLFRSVCTADYSTALADIGNLLFKSVSPCLEGDMDTRDSDAANPGIQPDCTVSDFTDVDTKDENEQQIPRCAMADANTPAAGARPCWWVASNAGSCPTTETHLELHVERSASAAAGTVTRVSCASAP